MKRRDLLRSAAITMVAASWPPFLRAAFAASPGPICEEDEARGVAAGLARARRHGKALLVLVVPTNPYERWARGVHFGELINHGSDEALALLATVEVACARPVAVACVAPAFERVTEPALMLLVEPTPTGATVTPLQADLFAVSQVDGPPPKTFAEQGKAEESQAQARIDALTELLRNALAGGDLERRAKENARTLSDSGRTRLVAASLDEVARLSLSVVDRTAPFLLARVWRRHDGAASPALARLAEAARRRIRDQPVPGSRWVHLTGCDEVVEGARPGNGGLACGMGGVPKLSARFLRFFADLEPPAS